MSEGLTSDNALTTVDLVNTELEVVEEDVCESILDWGSTPGFSNVNVPKCFVV